MRNDEVPAFRITGPGELEHEPLGQDNNPLEEAMKKPDVGYVPGPLYYRFSDVDHLL